MKPFMNMILAMDENNTIGHEGKLPWGPLPTDFNWYITLSTATKDSSKRNAIVIGRVTFEEMMKFNTKYVSHWHFIVITSHSAESIHSAQADFDKNYIDVVKSFEEANQRAKLLLDTPNSMIESVFVFGGAGPYEQALKMKVVQRVYLTRIFAKVPNCDTRVKNFDLSDFRRIKRPSGELLAELDDQILEENGWKYQFQVYERNDS